jgi:tetratricopeptide (TPR) repeat protein
MLVLGFLVAVGLMVVAWRAMGDARRARDLAARAEAVQQAGDTGLGVNGIDVGTLMQSIAELGNRVNAAEAAPRQSVEPDDRRAHELEEVLARLDALEQQLLELRERVEARPKPEDTPAGIAKAIRDLAGTDREIEESRKEQRIALHERFLELFPNDPDAIHQLEELIGENLGSRPALALESLERYGARIGAEPWQIDDLRANVLIQNQRFDEGRAAYARVMRSPASEHERATARFFLAYSYMKEGRYDEARSQFEQLIAQYGDDPPAAIADTVSGAKTQLAKIAEYTQKK